MKYTLPLLLGPALLLASCGDPKPPSNSLLALSGTVVEGKFEGTSELNSRIVTSAWTGGAGSVKGYLASESGPSEQPAATGTLTADGKFVLTLPTPTAAQLSALGTDDWNALEDELGFGEVCTPSLKISDNAARGTSLALAVDANKDGPILPFGYVAEEKPGQGKLNVTLGLLVYVDRSVTIEGSKTCTVEGVTLTNQVDLRLGKGWNKVQLAVSADEAANTASSSVVSGSFSSDNWVFMPSDVTSPLSLGSKLPKPSFLR